MSVIIKLCPFAELEAAECFRALTDEYARESGLDGLPKPKGHMESYRAMDTAGVMTTLCAYLGDRIVGFILVLVSVIPHYSVPIATLESFFVSHEHRASGAGMKLLHAAEMAAIEKGAAGLFVTAAVSSDLGKVMGGLASYRKTHDVFFRSFA